MKIPEVECFRGLLALNGLEIETDVVLDQFVSHLLLEGFSIGV